MTTRKSGALVCALALVILFGYAIARPATESLFLEQHGSGKLPHVWLAVAATTLVVVGAYNRWAAQLSLGAMMQRMLGISGASLLLLLLVAARLERLGSFALYVWKDVHIVILLEILWSFANLVFPTKTARWAYGLFCASGSLGGLAGNLSVGWLAARLGTRGSLVILLAVFSLAALLSLSLARAAGHPRPPKRERPSLGDGLKILQHSRYLMWLLALVALVQVATALVDFLYNDAIAAAYPDTDARTAVIGRVYAVIDVAAITLQLSTGLILRFAGLRITLLSAPILLAAALAVFAAAPRFLLMAIAKIASKAFDYSLFRAAKETLYIPLSYAEQTRGKAIIDMLAYRVAKGVASFVLLLLVAWQAGAVLALTALIIVTWVWVTLVVVRRYRHDTSP